MRDQTGIIGLLSYGRLASWGMQMKITAGERPNKSRGVLLSVALLVFPASAGAGTFKFDSWTVYALAPSGDEPSCVMITRNGDYSFKVQRYVSRDWPILYVTVQREKSILWAYSNEAWWDTTKREDPIEVRVDDKHLHLKFEHEMKTNASVLTLKPNDGGDSAFDVTANHSADQLLAHLKNDSIRESAYADGVLTLLTSGQRLSLHDTRAGTVIAEFNTRSGDHALAYLRRCATQGGKL